jgi:hypothetical protein
MQIEGNLSVKCRFLVEFLECFLWNILLVSMLNLYTHCCHRFAELAAKHGTIYVAGGIYHNCH